MTGKELIIYILENNLEDENVFKDGKFIGFETELEAAARLNTGVASLLAMYEMGMIPGIKIGGRIFIQCDSQPKERGAYEKII